MTSGGRGDKIMMPNSILTNIKDVLVDLKNKTQTGVESQQQLAATVSAMSPPANPILTEYKSVNSELMQIMDKPQLSELDKFKFNRLLNKQRQLYDEFSNEQQIPQNTLVTQSGLEDTLQKFLKQEPQTPQASLSPLPSPKIEAKPETSSPKPAIKSEAASIKPEAAPGYDLRSQKKKKDKQTTDRPAYVTTEKEFKWGI
jgi:hypothetical protein